MGTAGLTFHVPVGLFLRRIFNVASSFTLTNYYFLLKRTELEKEKEVDCGCRSHFFIQTFRSSAVEPVEGVRVTASEYHANLGTNIFIIDLIQAH